MKVRYMRLRVPFKKNKKKFSPQIGCEQPAKLCTRKEKVNVQRKWSTTFAHPFFFKVFIRNSKQNNQSL